MLTENLTLTEDTESRSLRSPALICLLFCEIKLRDLCVSVVKRFCLILGHCTSVKGSELIKVYIYEVIFVNAE